MFFWLQYAEAFGHWDLCGKGFLLGVENAYEYFNGSLHGELTLIGAELGVRCQKISDLISRHAPAELRKDSKSWWYSSFTECYLALRSWNSTGDFETNRFSRKINKKGILEFPQNQLTPRSKRLFCHNAYPKPQIISQIVVVGVAEVSRFFVRRANGSERGLILD